ncbi:MAG: T9SS type A sorting domain-containing protein, partial [Bacteroidota bacterium]
RWLPGGLPRQGLDVSQAGTYKLLITDIHGCIASDSLHISQHLLPLVYAGNDTTIMAGAELQLQHTSTTDTTHVEWTSQGSGYFGNNSVLETWYSPSYSDISTGTVELTLNATNQCGTSNDKLTLTIQQDTDGITVFPNPTQGIVTFVCTEGTSIQSASITTQAGTVIQSNIPVNGSVFQYDLSMYPPGTFLFHLLTGTITVTKIINKL